MYVAIQIEKQETYDNKKKLLSQGKKEYLDRELAQKIHDLVNEGADVNESPDNKPFEVISNDTLNKIMRSIPQEFTEQLTKSFEENNFSDNFMKLAMVITSMQRLAHHLKDQNIFDLFYNKIPLPCSWRTNISGFEHQIDWTKLLQYFSVYKSLWIDHGYSPLKMAANIGLINCAKVLIKAGADVNCESLRYLPTPEQEFLQNLNLWKQGGESRKSIESIHIGRPITSALLTFEEIEINDKLQMMNLLLQNGAKVRVEDAIIHFKDLHDLPSWQASESSRQNLQSKFFLEITKNYVDLNKLLPNLQASLGRANTAKDEEKSGIFSRSIEKIEAQIANLQEAAQNFYRADKALLDNPFVKIETHNPIVKELFDSIIAHEQLEELLVSSAEVSLSSGDTHGGYHVENNSHTDDLKVTGVADLDNV